MDDGVLCLFAYVVFERKKAFFKVRSSLHSLSIIFLFFLLIRVYFFYSIYSFESEGTVP